MNELQEQITHQLQVEKELREVVAKLHSEIKSYCDRLADVTIVGEVSFLMC